MYKRGPCSQGDIQVPPPKPNYHSPRMVLKSLAKLVVTSASTFSVTILTSKLFDLEYNSPHPTHIVIYLITTTTEEEQSAPWVWQVVGVHTKLYFKLWNLFHHQNSKVCEIRKAVVSCLESYVWTSVKLPTRKRVRWLNCLFYRYLSRAMFSAVSAEKTLSFRVGLLVRRNQQVLITLSKSFL